MKIVWDEPKRLANLAKHQLDFATLDFAYFLRAWFYRGTLGGCEPLASMTACL